MLGEISRTYDGPDDEPLMDRIRRLRREGELLGPLTDTYGATAVVAALGIPHVADSLGVWNEPEMSEEPDWPEE